ncbi:glycosyltransferase, partial [Candidatus Woesearchaeota archaeon]|nr:glycosyltransferase [Candidatus Woesearchaeota archaeon]
MKISIVIPAYNEEANLEPLVKDLLNLKQEIKQQYEILVVDDSSSDRTGSIADALAKQYNSVRVIHR